MKIAAIAGVLALTLGTASAQAQFADPMDSQFAAMASVGNTFEIGSSRLALQRSRNARIRAFARMMIADHTRAQAKLDAFAAASGTQAGLMIDPAHQQMLDQLSALSGAAFDQAYATDQVAAHQESQQMLASYVSSGENPNLQQYASTTLPIVNMHLRRIETLTGM